MSNKKPPATTPSSNSKAAGDLDLSFGINGIAVIYPPPTPPIPLYVNHVCPDQTALIEQKIYVACSDLDHVWIVRLLTDGAIDDSFGDKGYVLVPEDFTRSGLLNVSQFVFLESGNIVAYGNVFTSVQGMYGYLPAALCVTPAGLIDTSFGDEGFAIFELPLPMNQHTAQNATSPEANFKQAMLVKRDTAKEANTVNPSNATPREDGNLLFLGSVQGEAWNHIASYVFKINPDGSFDAGFGKGGVVLIEDSTVSPARLAECQNFDFSNSGEFVVTWMHREEGAVTTEGFVAKYDAQGLPDRVFGRMGVVPISSNPYGFATHMRGARFLDDDEIIVLVSFFTSTIVYQNPALMKLMPTGIPDPGFNNGEPVIIDLTSIGYMALGMVIDDEHRILIVGHLVGIDADDGACISRILPNGTPDEEFGLHGTVVNKDFKAFTMGEFQSGVNFVGTVVSVSMPSPDIMRLKG